MGSVSIFNTRYGVASMLRLPSSVKPCFNFRVGSYTNSNNSTVVTEFSIKKTENISVTPTLGTELFLYVGGESAYKIDISGIALKTCNSNSHGFTDIINWYESENVKNSGKPVKLVLGEKVYKGYLYELEVQSVYKMTNAFSFRATFVGVLA